MKAKINKVLSKIFKAIKFFVMFIFIPLILIAGIFVTIILSYYLANCEDVSSRYQLIIGLATSLFSTVLAASSVISLIVNQTKTNAHLTELTISLVNNFNDNYLQDFVFVRYVIKSSNQEKAYKPHKTPLIDSGDHPATDLPKGTSLSDYKAVVRKHAFYYLYPREGILSEELKKFLSNKSNFDVNNIANYTVYSIFKEKRIRVLNFFESMAIGIGNKAMSGELLKNQFSDLLNKTIPLLLIFIYNEEGEECYPALRAMLMEWFSKEKKQ